MQADAVEVDRALAAEQQVARHPQFGAEQVLTGTHDAAFGHQHAVVDAHAEHVAAQAYRRAGAIARGQAQRIDVFQAQVDAVARHQRRRGAGAGGGGDQGEVFQGYTRAGRNLEDCTGLAAYQQATPALAAKAQGLSTVDLDRLIEVVGADAQADGAADILDRIDGLLDGGHAAVVALGADAHRAVAAFALGNRRPEHAAVGFVVREVDHRQARIVMVDTQWRRLGEHLDAGIHGAGGEYPVVASLELATSWRQVEVDQNAVFEEKTGTGGENLDVASGAGGVEILHLVAVLAAHHAGLIPAPYPGVACRRCGLLGIGGEHASWQSQIKLQGAGAFVHAAGHADAPQFAGQTVQLTPVIGHFHPVAVVKAQHVVAADAFHGNAVTRRVDMADPRGHRGVVPRPFECGRAERAATMHFNPVQLVLQPAITSGGRHLARIGLEAGHPGGGRQAGRRGRD